MTLRRSISTFALLSLLASIMALAPLAPASAATAVFINELHYDNDGADVGEFVEVAGPAGTDLTGWSIVLYNGSGGASYATVDLSGTVDDQGEGFGAVSFAQAGIQNGSPDGLALVNGSTVEQFLSYEGAFSATNGDANGMMSVDIGVSEPSTSPVGESLQLKGTGSTDGDFIWTAPSPASPGRINDGQTFVPAGGNTPPTVTSDPSTLNVIQGETGSAAITATDDRAVTSLDATSPDPLPTGIIFTSTGADSGTLTVDGTAAVGSNTITYRATDNDGATATGTTTVNVQEVTPISAVQGDGTASPLAGNTVVVQGIVTSLFDSNDVFDGFFVQEAVPSDIDANTSEALFVFCRVFCNNTTGILVGDQVRVTGTVGEFQQVTQLTVSTSNGDIQVIASGNALPAASTVAMPAAGRTDAELTFESLETWSSPFLTPWWSASTSTRRGRARSS